MLRLRFGGARLFLFLFLVLFLCFRPAPTYAETYVGSKKSDVYHYTWCRHAESILPENIIYFSSPEKAISAGYRACLVCGPPDQTQPPFILINSPLNKTYSESNISLTFNVDEKVSWLAYNLDRGKNVTISGNITLVALSDGGHVVRVYAKTIEYNVYGEREVHFTVAIPPRSVALNDPSNVTANSLVLTWTGNADIDFKNYTICQSSVPDSLGTPVHVITSKSTHSYKMTDLTYNSSYYYTVRVYDKAGLHADSNVVQASTPIPELSSEIMIVVFMILSSFTVLFYKSKKSKSVTQQDKQTLSSLEFALIGQGSICLETLARIDLPNTVPL